MANKNYYYDPYTQQTKYYYPSAGQSGSTGTSGLGGGTPFTVTPQEPQYNKPIKAEDINVTLNTSFGNSQSTPSVDTSALTRTSTQNSLFKTLSDSLSSLSNLLGQFTGRNTPTGTSIRTSSTSNSSGNYTITGGGYGGGSVGYGSYGITKTPSSNPNLLYNPNTGTWINTLTQQSTVLPPPTNPNSVLGYYVNPSTQQSIQTNNPAKFSFISQPVSGLANEITAEEDQKTKLNKSAIETKNKASSTPPTRNSFWQKLLDLLPPHSLNNLTGSLVDVSHPPTGTTLPPPGQQYVQNPLGGSVPVSPEFAKYLLQQKEKGAFNMPVNGNPNTQLEGNTGGIFSVTGGNITGGGTITGSGTETRIGTGTGASTITGGGTTTGGTGGAGGTEGTIGKITTPPGGGKVIDDNTNFVNTLLQGITTTITTLLGVIKEYLDAAKNADNQGNSAGNAGQIIGEIYDQARKVVPQLGQMQTIIDTIDKAILDASIGFRKAAEEIRNNPDLSVWQKSRRLQELDDLQNYAPIFDGLSLKDLIAYRNQLGENMNYYSEMFNNAVSSIQGLTDLRTPQEKATQKLQFMGGAADYSTKILEQLTGLTGLLIPTYKYDTETNNQTGEVTLIEKRVDPITKRETVVGKYSLGNIGQRTINTATTAPITRTINGKTYQWNGTKWIEAPTNTNRFLTKDYFRTAYGDKLAQAAKNAGFTRGGFLGIGVGQEGIEDFLNDLMSKVETYRAAGYTDEEILKLMTPKK